MLKSALYTVLYGRFDHETQRFMLGSLLLTPGMSGKSFAPTDGPHTQMELIQRHKALAQYFREHQLEDFLDLPIADLCERAEEISCAASPRKITEKEPTCVQVATPPRETYNLDTTYIELYTAAWERIIGHPPRSTHFSTIINKHSQYRSASEFERLLLPYKDVITNEWILVRLTERKTRSVFPQYLDHYCEQIRRLRANPKYAVFQGIKDAFAIAVLIYAGDPVKHLDEALALAQKSLVHGKNIHRMSLYRAIRHRHNTPAKAA